MVEEIEVSILDLNVESGLGTTLRGMLESSPKSCIHLQERIFPEIHEAAFCDNGPSDTLVPFKLDLIFVILPPDYSKKTAELIRFLKGKQLPIIIIMEAGEPENMVELLKLGAVDFVIPPLKKMDIFPRMWRALEQRNTDGLLMSSLKQDVVLKQIIGTEPAFLAEINKIPLVANSNASILILGETGTGKELSARAIHYLSPQSGNPFVAVNCGAIPTELVESELFGHVKGAFTGASQSHPGLIHEANRGTLFLDEIDCLPLQGQVKLLRFLQDKEYRQIGSSKIKQADVRVIAASNLDLQKAVSEGKFRQDLFYRLNIIPLTLPPLRYRKADIPLLGRHFLRKYAAECKRPVKNFAPEALQKLLAYEWPGNVRELENVTQRAVIFCQQAIIQGADITLPGVENPPCQEPFQVKKARVIAEFEKRYIQDILVMHQGNITQAAKAAQKNRRAFWGLIRKYRDDIPNFNSSV